MINHFDNYYFKAIPLYAYVGLLMCCGCYFCVCVFHDTFFFYENEVKIRTKMK